MTADGLPWGRSIAELRLAAHNKCVAEEYLAKRKAHEEEREAMAKRRSVASAARIEATLQAGINQGLTPQRVSHYPDGRTTIEFGSTASDGTQGKKSFGWDDI